MTQELWAKMIKSLPPNLTAKQASRIFRRSVSLTRRRLAENGYRVKEARKYEIPEWSEQANWRLPNVDIAREFGLTRERVRQMRNRLGHPMVECRGRRNGNGKH